MSAFRQVSLTFAICAPAWFALGWIAITALAERM